MIFWPISRCGCSQTVGLAHRCSVCAKPSDTKAFWQSTKVRKTFNPAGSVERTQCSTLMYLSFPLSPAHLTGVLPPLLATGVINSILFGVQGWMVHTIVSQRSPEVSDAATPDPHEHNDTFALTHHLILDRIQLGKLRWLKLAWPLWARAPSFLFLWRPWKMSRPACRSTTPPKAKSVTGIHAVA